MEIGLRPTAPPTACADIRFPVLFSPVWDRLQDCPYRHLKRRACRIERRAEVRLLAGEIQLEPPHDLPEYGEVFFVCRRKIGEIPLPIEVQPRECDAVTRERDPAERGGVVCCVDHGGPPIV